MDKKNNNKRTEAILEALDLINGARNSSYGDPVHNFTVTAEQWSVGRDEPVEPWEVAIKMIDVKLARIKSTNRFHRDSLIDIIGYAALAIEVHDET
jgi:hypothetical protein